VGADARRRVQWGKILQMRRQRRIQSIFTFGLVLLGPVLALATYLVLGPLDQGSRATSLRLVLMCDFIYVLLIIGVVVQRIFNVISQRREKSSGSRLHLRLTGVFTIMALVPTITVAVFATVSINMGFEAWFSDRVQNVIGASLSAAQAYETEQKTALRQDALTLSDHLVDVKIRDGLYEPANIRNALDSGQRLIQRGLSKAFILNSSGDLLVRGYRSYLFDLKKPSLEELKDAIQNVVFISDYENDELRALAYLPGFSDHYLYITRQVNGKLLTLLDETQQTAQLYQQLESDRGQLLFNFGLLYLAFAVLLIMSSVLLALWFAERLSRPIGRLAGAAQRVGEGELDTQVVEEEGDDEIAQLSIYFNQMTRQLKHQRETLLENTAQIEERRRLFDSVLSSVTSGVIGLDAMGHVSFVNTSAERLLGFRENDEAHANIEYAVPEFSPLFQRLKEGGLDNVQDEVKVIRGGRLENLLVRMSPRRSSASGLLGYVVAFDDVTDLVSAQRSAAWGDVARRIAHEIKNPLTPIQLSAERIKRKFAPKLVDDSDALEQMTSVIIRQTNDLRRIVDEFSKFARMPEPEKRQEDIIALVKSAVTLQEAGQPTVTFVTDLPSATVETSIDATMITQALTNLIKNAGEAIETRLEKGIDPDVKGEIRIEMSQSDEKVHIIISDNGVGLPQDRARLFEPYVTTRDKGTGLGLPIVKKIIEEHGGALRLEDAVLFENATRAGACAIIELPKTRKRDFENEANGDGATHD
jgi:two-component system nitrogen regulation sensor histidine kinase NtrY